MIQDCPLSVHKSPIVHKHSKSICQCAQSKRAALKSHLSPSHLQGPFPQGFAFQQNLKKLQTTDI